MRAAIARVALASLLVASGARAQDGTSAPGGRAAWSTSDDGAPIDFKARGNEKMIDSDFVGAIRDYQAALTVTPNDPALYYNLGRAHGLLGHWPESLAALDTFAARATPDLRARIAGFDALLADARQHVGYLVVACAVPHARVQVGDVVVGEAPIARRGVNAGPATLRIEAEGYLPDTRAITFAPQDEARIDCRLLPRSTSGTLAVTASPAGTRVFVDGTFRGDERAELGLPAGAHEVSAQREGFETTTTIVMIQVGATRSLDLTLHPKPVPITARWWFWGGVAAVVAGGVAVSIAALTEKPADQGSIAPRQLGTPLRF